MKEIELTQGFKTIVDDEDYEWLSQYRWCAVNEGKKKPLWYAVAKVYGKNVKMHRLLLGDPAGVVDHRNRNSLDNRRENLSTVTQVENSRNKRHSSNNKLGVKGVNFHRGAFCARIWYNNRNIHLGRFATLREAQLAYDEKAIEVFGEYAATNKSLGILAEI